MNITSNHFCNYSVNNNNLRMHRGRGRRGGGRRGSRNAPRNSDARAATNAILTYLNPANSCDRNKASSPTGGIVRSCASSCIGTWLEKILKLPLSSSLSG